ncbi:MAG: hypothetical protein OHK0029_08350 [Armatimonadaceae bacterium]
MTRRIYFIITILVSFAGLLASLLTGCGGGGGGNTGSSGESRGQMEVRLSWAERRGGRQAPADASSVRVAVKEPSGRVLVERLLVRPSVSASVTVERFDSLPQTTVLIEATAFPHANGTGTAQARATSQVTVLAGRSTTLNLSLESTVERVAILPDTIPLTGQPVLIHAAAYDRAGNQVLTSQWDWQNSNPLAVSLQPQGNAAVVRAVGPGNATITLIETQSGEKRERTFHVAPLAP